MKSEVTRLDTHHLTELSQGIQRGEIPSNELRSGLRARHFGIRNLKLYRLSAPEARGRVDVDSPGILLRNSQN